MSNPTETTETPPSAGTVVEPIWLTPADLQTRWKVSRNKVYEIIASPGFPPPLRLGRSLRYPAVEVRAWEQASREVATLPPSRRGKH